MKNSDTSTKKATSSIALKGLSLSVLTLGSRILGLIREMTKAHFLGTSSQSDAFSIAFLVPNLFRRLFAENSISVAFIPTFKAYLKDNETPEDKKTTQEFISATFTLLCFLVTTFVVLCMFLTPLILRIFYGFKKYDLDSFSEAVILTRMMFPYLVVISIAAFFQGILNGVKIFSPSGFTPILFNGIVIAFTYIFAPHTANPARAMAIGVVTGGTVQALFQLPFVLKTKWTVSFTSLKNAFTNPGTRKVLKLVAPTIVGMAAYQLNDIFSTSIANRVNEGLVSSLQYSLRLQELILGIFAVTIGTVILPDLTGFAKQKKWEDFNKMLTNALKIMILISIPVTAYCIIMKRSLVATLFATGRFNENSIETTTAVFHFHIIGLVFIALNRILSPSFYAQEDAVSPTFAGIINVVVNIVLAYALSIPMGGNGIALALSIASAVNTIILFVLLFRKHDVDSKHISLSSGLYALKIAVFSIIAAVPVYFARAPLLKLFEGHNRWISYGFPVAISAILFAAVGVILLVVTKDSIISPLLKKAAGILKARSK
ncbi:MAG: murein biosynthesis integral membrane protein MurJ [Spirochaetaceae bacterium]|nr:murein biosynthesis integral membrane protein MurJ [Spirochaetaceae bacterium]